MNKLVDPKKIKLFISPVMFYQQNLGDFNSMGKQSWVDGGICPFHDDRTKGSFKINLDSGAYHCFSCGASGGDIIAFTQQQHGLEFPEALDVIAQEWGIAS